MNPDRRWTPVQKRVGILTVLLALSAPGLSALQQPGARRSAEMTEPGSGPLDNEQKIALMTGNELQKIRSRQQRIEQLPEAAQARLRSIHQQWLAHPRRDELLQTMKAYYEWWKTLSVEERARVKSETGPARLQVVKNIIQERAEAVFGIAGETRLPREDVTRLFEWNREFVISKRDQLIELYRSRESRRGSRRLDQMLEQTRQQPETLFWLLYRLRDDQAVQLIEPGDIESLRAKLSSEAVAIIDAQNDEAARQKLVYRWLISAVSAMESTHSGTRIDGIL